MDLLLGSLHLLAFVATALSLAVPAVRRVAIALLAVAAAGSLLGALTGPDPRSLTTVHTYAGFEGSALEVSMVRFPTGTVEAAGFAWALPFAGFAALWIGVLVVLGRRQLQSALVLPLLFAWTATAAWIGMQLCASPSEVVQPLGLDRFLFPAGLATALLAARTQPRFWRVLLAISAGTIAARLPAALFSKVASDQHLGTSLDVTLVRDIVNPMTQTQFEPRLVPGSGAHQFWLIWLEHVIVFPTLYLLSLAGVAFATFMFHQHTPERHGAPAPAGPTGSRT